MMSFCFKGSRKYVQGPDIIDAAIPFIMKHYGEVITQFKYSAHEMLRSNANLIFNNSPEEKLNSLISFVPANTENQIYASIVENGNVINKSIEYKEDEIHKLCDITGKEILIEINNLNKFSFSELIVSMNKYYMQQSIDNRGKWIVTKIEYNSLEMIDGMNVRDNVKLELLKNLNNKLTKSAVYISNIHVGHIYFSLVNDKK